MNEIQRIMVVDDEPGICQNVSKILARNDYEVYQASSAKEALEEMAQKTYSLMISDIVMPEMNGLELLKLVKDQWPLTRVLMMTAYASTDTAVKAIRLGALDYLPKPFTPGELRELVDKSLSGQLIEAPVNADEKRDIDAMHLQLPMDKLQEADTGEDFCPLGEQVCDVFAKLGKTCKAGMKKGVCPKRAKEAREAGQAAPKASGLIGVDAPFDYEELVDATGPEYVAHMGRDGCAFMPYEELKASAARVEARLRREKAMREGAQARHIPGTMDALEEVAEAVGPDYARNLDRDGFSRLSYGELKESAARMQARYGADAAAHIEPAWAADILVVDDEVAVNNNIRKILKKSKYAVDQATTKEEALEKIAGGFYRIIVLDLKIPGVNGLELLEAVRNMQPEAKVIIITGYASIETAVETSRMGAMQYVPKPFTPAEFRTAVEKASSLAA